MHKDKLKKNMITHEWPNKRNRTDWRQMTQKINKKKIIDKRDIDVVHEKSVLLCKSTSSETIQP